MDVFQEVESEKRPVRYWSQDESRLGLKTITRRLLTLPGVKPVGPIQWQFEAFYLYGAVEPITGESCFLEFSHLDSVCFQAFLNEFSQTYVNSLNILQLDNGSPHLAKNLTIPNNVILLFQPSYSPDVNPIERVWQSVKDKLSWLTVATLDELRRELDVVLNSLTAECIASLTGYDFILSALKKARLVA
ncbi:MAG TPA: IS630 family transposase [Saprospiraceae bacterium]|nr:IS630 family transposase [Saprospiraceae bacterium]